MFCPNCGKDLKSKEVNFCSDCGKNLSDLKDAEREKQNSQPIDKTISKKLSEDHTFSKNKIAKEVVGAIDKGYIPGSKSEPDKKLTGTNHLSKLNKKETPSLPKKTPKQRKWGWGWYIVAFIVYKMLGLDKEIDDDLTGIIYSLAMISSVLIYFVFRNRFFKNFPNIYLRSFSAGFISIITTLILTAALLVLFVRLSPSQRNVFDELSTEVKRATLIADKKMEEYNLLMADFVYEPTTIDDAKNNIIISEKTLVISNFVDSVALSMYRRIYDVLLSVEKSNPQKLSGSKISSALTQSIIEKLITYSLKNRTSTQAIIDYYNAWIDESAEQDELWNIYEAELEKFTVAEKEYFELYNHFTQLAEK